MYSKRHLGEYKPEEQIAVGLLVHSDVAGVRGGREARKVPHEALSSGY